MQLYNIRFFSAFAGILIFTGMLCAQGPAAGYQAPGEQKQLPIIQHDKVRNVIICIGDGMSVATVSASRYKGAGVRGKLHMDRMPISGLVRTCSADKLITDSAASSTAFSSGFKTGNGVIGRTPDGRDVVTIMEAAKAKGLKAGLVVTSSITHATPAGFAAHVSTRKEEINIAVHLLQNKIDVLLGGGLKYFGPPQARREDGRNLLEEARQTGYSVIRSREELEQIKTGSVLGLFADAGMTTHDPEPTLAQMTRKAIEILAPHKQGFILMVEGSQIDWANHDNNFDEAVRQTLLFDLAIKEALDFAQKDGKTLVLVTADHETGGMAIVGGKADASEIEVAWTTKGHSGSTVLLYAYGPGCLLFSGFQDNTEMPIHIAELLKITDFPRLRETPFSAPVPLAPPITD